MAEAEQFSALLHGPATATRLAPLLSIHMTSNRPGNFVQFLDRLQNATLVASSVEVVVKVDDTDDAINRLVEKEARNRPFRVKYLSTPLDRGVFRPWRWYCG